ncbi:MAG TPA: CDP-alcohol phosphatidyltransferase family protein [Vicinamibacterales bacterium]
MTHHAREHGSLTAGVEKQLLVWIARRLPAWLHSDHLTLLALAAMALAGAGYALARYDRRALWLVLAALVLNWFGDSLDGTLARVRHAERPRYGFYVDHVLDIVGITLLMAGLACSGFMSPIVALALLVAYLLVSGEVFLATAVHRVFRMSFAGFGPTELRIVLGIGTVALFRNPLVALGSLGRFPLFDVGAVVATAGLGLALAMSIARNTRSLARAEPRAVLARPSVGNPVESGQATTA